MVYCDCLENSWVNSPGGSNPSPSAEGATRPFRLLGSAAFGRWPNEKAKRYWGVYLTLFTMILTMVSVMRA